MPHRVPSFPINAPPPQNGCAGDVNIASSIRYSQYPANSRFSSIRVVIALLCPPKPENIARSPTETLDARPNGKGGEDSSPRGWTSPKPVSLSYPTTWPATAIPAKSTSHIV